MEVAGRNFVSGLPKTMMLSSNDTIEAFDEPLSSMLETIHNVLGRTPPELLSDITENGVCITGGGALLYGLDRLISEKTGLRCYVAEGAIFCVAIGTGMAADSSNMGLQNNMQNNRGEGFIIN